MKTIKLSSVTKGRYGKDVSIRGSRHNALLWPGVRGKPPEVCLSILEKRGHKEGGVQYTARILHRECVRKTTEGAQLLESTLRNWGIKNVRLKV